MPNDETVVEIVLPYKPRPLQRRLHEVVARFSVIVAHRRFGKTIFAINHLLRKAGTCGLHNPQVAYIAPTYGQAKRNAWRPLKEVAEKIPGVSFNEVELKCLFPASDGQALVWLLSAENPDALRGIYLDAVVLDEYQLMRPGFFDEVIRPLLSDRKGSCLWIGTPKGAAGAFKDIHDTAAERMAAGDPDWFTIILPASATNVLDPQELAAIKLTTAADAYAQEYECSWAAGSRGAYFAQIVETLRQLKRIVSVPADPRLPVCTAWDLGMHDATAIWFFQRNKQEIRVVDYYEQDGIGLPQHVRAMRNLPYTYGDRGAHFFPWDITVSELGTGVARIEILRSLGIRPVVVPKLALQDGIDAVRRLLPLCWFDEENTRDGVRKLERYARKWSEQKGLWLDRPNHDENSHAADAFRALAVAVGDDLDADATADTLARWQRSGRMDDGRPLVVGEASAL